MDLDKIPAGNDVPDDINVIIEIPAHGSPVKYHLDRESGALVVDRFMNAAVFYPCNYGFVPHTRSEKGGPVEVLAISPVPVVAGCVMACRPVGMLRMTDESGADNRILAVPASELYGLYDHVQTATDLPRELLAQIRQFFEHHKGLEPNKWVKVDEWVGPAEAKAEIVASQKRYQKSKV